MKKIITLSLAVTLLLAVPTSSYGMTDQITKAQQTELNAQLMGASENGELDKVKQLIQDGADVNAKNNAGHIPLHKAKSAEIAKELINAGSTVNARTNSQNIPLHWAQTDDIAQVLIDSGSDINAQNNRGETPLHFAAQQNNLKVVQALINAGVDLDLKTNLGDTAQEMSRYRAVGDALKNFAQDLESFLNNPTSKSFLSNDNNSLTDEGNLLLEHLYNGLKNKNYSEKLATVGVKFMEDGKRDLFDTTIRKLYINDKNSDRRKIYNSVKEQLNLFEMAQARKTDNIKFKAK